MEKELKGMPLDLCGIAWDYANEYIKDKPDLVAISDIESGFPVVMSKDEAKVLSEMFESCRPKVSSVIDNRIFYFGTGGRVSKGNLFESMIYNQSND